MAKRGPKPTYDRDAISAEVLQILSRSDRSMVTILASDKRYPCEKQWFNWLNDSEQLVQDYARAKEMQADHIAWQTLAIADDTSEDEIFIEADDTSGKSAKRVCNNEFINRSRLRVDARKWLAGKLAPKKYGDKIELSGNADAPLTINVVKFGG